jgi:hypothetical protein
VQKEREDYEVVIEDSKFLYKKSREIIDTSGGPRDAKWIFVLSTSKSLYVGQVNIQLCTYHHIYIDNPDIIIHTVDKSVSSLCNIVVPL